MKRIVLICTIVLVGLLLFGCFSRYERDDFNELPLETPLPEKVFEKELVYTDCNDNAANSWDCMEKLTLWDDGVVEINGQKKKVTMEDVNRAKRIVDEGKLVSDECYETELAEEDIYYVFRGFEKWTRSEGRFISANCGNELYELEQIVFNAQ